MLYSEEVLGVMELNSLLFAYLQSNQNKNVSETFIVVTKVLLEPNKHNLMDDS